MSAIGTKRTWACALQMSAIGGKTDMPFCTANVRLIHARRDTPDPSAQSPAAQSIAPVTVGNPPAMGIILRASCGPDAQRLCAGARRESDVLKCLDSQRMKLSTTCSSYFQKLGPGAGAPKNTPNKKPPSPPPAKPPAKPPGNDTEPDPG